MAFCTKCGASVQTEYCPQCGTRVVAPPAAPPQPRPAAPVNINPPQPVAAPVAGPKKRSPLVWVAVGCVGLLVLAGVIAVSTGLFVAYKAKQAGFDPALIQKNPGLAVAKMVTSANPDLEVVSVDENRGIIKVREKKTGKTLTMNLEDARNGRISFKDDTGQTVELEAKGDGSSGALKVRGPEGTMELGAGGKPPDWIPSYPGAESLGSMLFTKTGQAGGTYSFKTSDDGARVTSFYEDALKKQGFEVERVAMGQAGMALLRATQANSGRTVQVTVTTESAQGTVVGITFETGK